MKNPACEAVKRETEEDWGKGRLGGRESRLYGHATYRIGTDLIGELRKLEEQLVTKRQAH
jgi:hypothetical protein